MSRVADRHIPTAMPLWVAGNNRGRGKMPASFINDPEYWRDRAKEKRRLAEGMKDQLSKEKILRIARDYERLAQRAEERSKG